MKAVVAQLLLSCLLTTTGVVGLLHSEGLVSLPVQERAGQ